MEDTAAKPSLNLKTTNKTGLIWLDLEMTGLNPDSDSIIEIATVVTDDNLNVLAEGPMLAIFTKQERLAAMDEWNTHQHSASGLIERVRASTISIADAEAQTLAFLQQWTAAGTSPMCGNSICQDRRFLAKHMPALERFFHYRNLDVSSVKELCQRWRPDLAFSKNSNHLALDDIYDSIAELRFYREHFFACNRVAIC